MTAYQVMPGLTADEYADLRDDIAANGVRVPVDVDENGQVLDGHHRALIAAELGIECPRRVLGGLSEDEKIAHAYAVNIQRRSLTRDQKRALVAASLSRDPHLSDRQHAQRTGVDHKTVGAVRGGLESVGEIPQQDVRLTSDGKLYPAHVTTTTRTTEATKVEHDVDLDTGEILDGPTLAGRAAADRAPLPRIPRSDAEWERDRIGKQNGWIARALKHLDGIQDEQVRSRLVREWDPTNCDDNPSTVDPALITDIADGLRAFAKELKGRHVRVI